MNDYILYKDRPLVKSGETMYYGYAQDGFIVMLKTLDTVEESGETLPNNIALTLMKTSSDLSNIAIEKTAQKVGLAPALEMADIWLTTYAPQPKAE